MPELYDLVAAPSKRFNGRTPSATGIIAPLIPMIRGEVCRKILLASRSLFNSCNMWARNP